MAAGTTMAMAAMAAMAAGTEVSWFASLKLVGFSSQNFAIKNSSHNNNDGTNLLAIIEKTLNIILITIEHTDKNTASNKKTNSDDIVFFSADKKNVTRMM